MLDSIRLSNSSESELQNRDQLIDQMRKHVETTNAAKRKVELALEESRRRFSEFAERSSDWAWELDEHGAYTYSSPRVKDILGLQPEEVLGRTTLDLVSQEEADRVSAILTRTMESRAPITALEKEMRPQGWPCGLLGDERHAPSRSGRQLRWLSWHRPGHHRSEDR